MIKAESINDIQINKKKYLYELYNDKNVTKQFKDFILSIDESTNDANSNAHEGFQRDILLNIFKLFGINAESLAKFTNFFNDEIIKKVKALIKNIYQLRIKGLSTGDLEKEFKNLKKLVNQNEFNELFK